jgi:hypothetical protein
MSGALSIASANQVALNSYFPTAVTDYVLYCVTFEAPPTAATSNLAADGAFSVELPVDTAFGCFVNNKSTNKTVATFKFEQEASGSFGSSTSTQGAFNSDLSLGSLSINLTTGTVTFPSTVTAAARSTASDFTPADLHDKDFAITCEPTGDSVADAKCASDFLDGGNSAPVYMRAVQATASGATMYGISAWQSKTAYTNCGGIVFNTAEKNQIESETDPPVFATSGTYAAPHAASFSNYNTSTCPTRSGTGTPAANAIGASENIQNQYCLAPLEIAGGGFGFQCYSSPDPSDTLCVGTRVTSFSLTKGSDGSFTGAVTVNEYPGSGATNPSAPECTDERYNAIVKFTPQ